MSNVEATRVPTFTWLVLPKVIPLGFTKNNVPLAKTLPNMLLDWSPVTRLNSVAETEGWMTLTVSAAPILKELKLMTVLLSAVILRVLASG